MVGSPAGKARRKANTADERLFDRELEDLPPELRWREWMMRVEAVISASAEPVNRETLARVVGRDCSIDMLIDDLIEELRDRPYELVSVAGGWQHRTLPRFAETIRASSAPTRGGAAALSAFGMETLRDLPNIEALEDAGMLSKHAVQNVIAASNGGKSEVGEEPSFIE